jgi:aerobic carbon-monoxide dehydrogenase medium subunit
LADDVVPAVTLPSSVETGRVAGLAQGENEAVKLPPFTLHRPTSISEATGLLRELGDEAVIYGGGTELLLVMKLGLSGFDHLIDIKRIPGLGDISVAENTLRIGGAATHHAIETNQVIRERWPSLAAMTRQVANARVRSVGTLGGNLAFADPASDPATYLMACDATIELRDAEGTTRHVPIGEFQVGAYQSALSDFELIDAILVPELAAGTAVVHERVRFHERPAVTVTVVAAARAGRVTEVRIAVGSLGPVAVRITEMEAALCDVDSSSLASEVEMSVEAVAERVEPMDDLNGSVEYKRHLASVVVERAVRRCLGRALDLNEAP